MLITKTKQFFFYRPGITDQLVKKKFTLLYLKKQIPLQISMLIYIPVTMIFFTGIICKIIPPLSFASFYRPVIFPGILLIDSIYPRNIFHTHRAKIPFAVTKIPEVFHGKTILIIMKSKLPPVFTIKIVRKRGQHGKTLSSFPHDFQGSFKQTGGVLPVTVLR